MPTVMSDPLFLAGMRIVVVSIRISMEANGFRSACKRGSYM